MLKEISDLGCTIMNTIGDFFYQFFKKYIDTSH